MTRKTAIVLACVGVFTMAGVFYAGLLPWKRLSGDDCLKNNEVASYAVADTTTRPGKAVVTVTDTSGVQSPRQIEVDLLNPAHYHPVEIHGCHFYHARSINYDFERRAPLVGYESGIWRSSYQGGSERIVLIADARDGKRENAHNYYGADFRVSGNERFIVLTSGFSQNESYALVLKNIANGKNELVLLMSEVIKNSPQRNGVFDLHGWSKDSRYFWAGTSETAYVKSYIRVDTSDWSYQVFDAPEGAMGGSPLNLEYGLVPINPGAQWTGSASMDEILTRELRAEGFVNRLFLYNLFTKERIFLGETTKDPLFWFEPEWFNDTTLQYTMPDGTTRTYTVK